MSMKLVVVCGATGNQGSSVVNALLAARRFAIRGLTRDVNSPAAKALTAQGVEMVPGQQTNKTSLLDAFKGAYAVFGVTNAPFVPNLPSDYEQGVNIVDACKANDVPLFVWSSLPHVSQSSGGKYVVKAFDDKAEMDKYIKSVSQPAVIFKLGAFVSNTTTFRQLRRDPSDPSKWHLHYPWVRASVPAAVTDIERDLGPSVVAAIDRWEDLESRRAMQAGPIPLVSYETSGEEKVEIIRRVTGKDVNYVRDEPTDGPNAHPMLKAMYQWVDEQFPAYEEAVPSERLLRLGVKLHSYEDYVREVIVPYMQKQA